MQLFMDVQNTHVVHIHKVNTPLQPVPRSRQHDSNQEALTVPPDNPCHPPGVTTVVTSNCTHEL